VGNTKGNFYKDSQYKQRTCGTRRRTGYHTNNVKVETQRPNLRTIAAQLEISTSEVLIERSGNVDSYSYRTLKAVRHGSLKLSSVNL
jgi:hypothetical protein